MSKKEKALAKIRQNPKHVRFEELENILLHLGFTQRQSKGSHRTFTLGRHIIRVPVNKPFLKPVYVKLALRVLDEIDELNELDNE
jgi:predicted RNA binding protein YcfA (HicA-like mRNA interferase family)